MSNAKAKPIAEINLEEFERRLRASVAPQAAEDPLAELTRLVDTIGLERTPAERALEAERALRPAPRPELRLAPPSPPEAPKPAPRASEPPATRPPPSANAEPPLRPSFEADDIDSSAFEPPPPAPALEEVAAAEYVAEEPEAPARPRYWGLKIGGLIAAAAVMAGAVVVFKVGARAHLGPPPLILASTAPTKVAPPSAETVRTANETGALLTRDTAQPTPTPPKLVNPPEAPVDLSARPEPSPTLVAAPTPTMSAPAPTLSATPTSAAQAPTPTSAMSPTASPVADTETSPVAPSSDTPIVAPTTATATPISPVSADPSRVKTISVRPDGTLISSGYESATAEAPVPTPSPTASAAAADGEASSPAVALPTKLSPPKSAARVVAKTETTAPADAGDGPAPVKPRAKPKVVAEADSNPDDADVPAYASGGYAVQLAAPKSSGEAKALIKSLEHRYAEALGGTALGARKAMRHGETIYRVRAGGLSRADAAAMCQKIKAAGGDCYIAKD